MSNVRVSIVFSEYSILLTGSVQPHAPDTYIATYTLQACQTIDMEQVLELMQMHPKERLRSVILIASWFNAIDGGY